MTEISIHPQLMNKILSFEKTAFMMPVILGQMPLKIHLVCSLVAGLKEVAFATAIVRRAITIRVFTVEEKMQYCIDPVKNTWTDLSKGTIKNLLKAEGIHPDDFWKRFDKRPEDYFEITQYYFDTVKPIIHA